MHHICIFWDVLGTISYPCRWLKHDTSSIWGDRFCSQPRPRTLSIFSPLSTAQWHSPPAGHTCPRGSSQAGSPELAKNSATEVSLNLAGHRTWGQQGFSDWLHTHSNATIWDFQTHAGSACLSTHNIELHTALTFLSTHTLHLPAN